jgi:hypothetical protein
MSRVSNTSARVAGQRGAICRARPILSSPRFAKLSSFMVASGIATIAAKIRGIDITCGCFGHASQHWSFPSHLATNIAILTALLVLSFKATFRNRLQNAV